MDGLSEAEFYKKKSALMRRMTKKQTKHIYDKDKDRGKKLSVEQKLVKYANSMRYDPSISKPGNTALSPYQVAPTQKGMQKINTFHRENLLDYGDGDRETPVLSVRRIHILDGNIKEEQNEESEFMSTSNCSYF